MSSSERKTGTPPLLHLFCFFALSRLLRTSWTGKQINTGTCGDDVKQK
ncbi:unnamed protein product [Tetraodon nigroviridis]|uniref:(spotted green pufferfish) hypothetical protein n=1 Tax=Tetraodon nigroviridis TaxID=99883 RepID=Q4T0P1_TETNG|nr:unnamed protein product [Tetraodon nigroviridis]